MKTLAMFVLLLVWHNAASEELEQNPQQPSVEILGVKITRGMPEADVRAAFPNVYCAEEDPLDPNFDFCSVSNGVPPDTDGSIMFKDGFVYQASRTIFVPEVAKPHEVFLMLTRHVKRLAGEQNAVCAKIETHSDGSRETTMIVFPEKVLSVQTWVRGGSSGTFFKESLRVNPVPDQYKTRGARMQGDEWCSYVN